MLASLLSREFLLHIPCSRHFYLGRFSYTSRAGFIFIWGVSLTYTVLALILCWEFLLDILCWGHFYLGSSLTHPVLTSFLFGEFLLHIPCWPLFYERTFSDRCHAGFNLIWGVSLTHPVLALLLCREFLLHIPCWLYVYVGSFSYTSCAGFIFMRGVSLTYAMLTLFVCREFLLHIPCLLFFSFFFSFFLLLCLASFSYKSHPGFIHLRGVCLTHPMLTLFLCGEFLLHIPCCLQFYAGNFSDTSRAGFIFMQGVSLTHPVLASFLYLGSSYPGSSRATVFFYIPCCRHFYLGSFSYTSRAGFNFISVFSITDPKLACFCIRGGSLDIP